MKNEELIGRRVIEAMLARLRVGSLTVAEAGSTRTYGRGEPSGFVEIHSPRVWGALMHGSRGLAETYADGLWDSPDPADVVRICALNLEPLDRIRRVVAPIRGPFRRATGIGRHNTRSRTREAIAAHYDRGNEMFELMLDPTMTYSCGFFESPDATLQQAQVAKLDRVCRKLDLGPGDHVLEIGTGWGSFSVHAAREYGCRVTTTTVSQAQFSYAEELIAREGLGERITLLLEDYRDLRDRYDKLVSIEMIEAVGWRDFPTFFERCSALLDPAGTMLLQAITIDDRAYEVEKYSASFIRQVIFPDGCLPSVNVISSCLTEETDMSLIGLEDISAHYVRTLRSWRENLEHHADELRRRGFDAKFQRLWRLYLAYCEAGFAERRIRDVQMLMAKPAFRAEPIIEYRKLESRDSIPRDSVHRMNFEQVGSSRFARGQAGGDSDPVAR